MNSPFTDVQTALAAIRQGRMIVVVDDEDRENEGDLTIAAEFATPEAINFMAKHGRGLICLALTEDRLDYLRLGMMTAHNTSQYGTAFTESIDARDGITTGISAYDRSRTIKVAIDPAEIAQLHASFTNAVRGAWAQLGVMPQALADSAKSESAREKLAAKRVDDYFARMVQEQAPFVPVPTPVSNLLRKKYKYSFNDAGFDRAVQEAAKIRSSADSSRTANQPQTAVPLNPAMPSGAPPTASSTPGVKK